MENEKRQLQESEIYELNSYSVQEHDTIPTPSLMANEYAYLSEIPKRKGIYLYNVRYASFTDGVNSEFLPLRMEVTHFNQVKDLPKSFRTSSNSNSSDRRTKSKTDAVGVHVARILGSSPLRENFEMLGLVNQTHLKLRESVTTLERDDDGICRSIVINYQPEQNSRYENMSCGHRDKEGESMCLFISADKHLKLGAQDEQGLHAGKRVSKRIKHGAIAKLYHEMQDDDNERARFKRLAASMLNTHTANTANTTLTTTAS